MKPTSIIFLVIAVVIVCAGFITCTFAEKSAESKNIQIFESTVDNDNNSIADNDFSDKTINKLEIIVSGADINVYGGADRSHIELINFNEGMYTYTATGKAISVSETPNIVSMLKFWENGFNFNGIRYFVRFGVGERENKQVNIYIADNTPVKKLMLQTDGGDINIKSLKADMDYTVVSDKGNVTFSSVSTKSTVTVTGKAGNVSFNESTVFTLNATLGDGDLTGTRLNTKLITAEVDTGDVLFDLARGLVAYNFNLATESGSVNYEGVNKNKEYVYTEGKKDDCVVNIKVKTGSIAISQSTAQVADTEETASPETTAETTAETAA